MVQFASPIFLILLLVVALLLIVLRRLHSWGLRPAVVFSSFSPYFAASVRQMRQNLSVKVFRFLKVLRVMVLVLLVVTLARPQLTQSHEQRSAKGIDILLVLDISESMRAEDFAGASRIEVAKSVIEDFLMGRRNDRVGLVVFAGESFTVCPLTLDYAVLTELLGDVEIGQLEDGTAIGDAVSTAVRRLRLSGSKTKLAILLTDGENNSGSVSPEVAGALAGSFGIKVYTVGLGGSEGARIPYADTTFGKRYRKVLTHLDEVALRELAAATGGSYFRATDPESLKRIYGDIDRFEKTQFNVITTMVRKELAGYLLIPTLLLLGLDLVLQSTVLRKIP